MATSNNLFRETWDDFRLFVRSILAQFLACPSFRFSLHFVIDVDICVCEFGGLLLFFGTFCYLRSSDYWHSLVSDDMVSKFIFAASNRSPFNAIERRSLYAEHSQLPNIGFRKLQVRALIFAIPSTDAQFVPSLCPSFVYYTMGVHLWRA